MSMQPILQSSLKEHLKLARELRNLEIHLPEKCKGVWQCDNVCPVGCSTPNYEKRVVVFHDAEKYIACGACVLQCPEDAPELKSLYHEGLCQRQCFLMLSESWITRLVPFYRRCDKQTVSPGH